MCFDQEGIYKNTPDIKEHLFLNVLLRLCLGGYEVSGSFSNPHMSGAQALTWKVAFTQVCTAAPEDPRMSGVIRGLEDSWLPSWSHSLYLKSDILSLLFGSTVRSPVGINKMFLFYDLPFQTEFKIDLRHKYQLCSHDTMVSTRLQPPTKMITLSYVFKCPGEHWMLMRKPTIAYF